MGRHEMGMEWACRGSSPSMAAGLETCQCPRGPQRHSSLTCDFLSGAKDGLEIWTGPQAPTGQGTKVLSFAIRSDQARELLGYCPQALCPTGNPPPQ